MTKKAPGAKATGGFFCLSTGSAAELLEEVIPLVVHQDERREVFHLDLPDRLHPQFGEVDALYFLDVLFGQHRGRAADGAEVETTVFLAGVGHLLAPVPLGDHDEARPL